MDVIHGIWMLQLHQPALVNKPQIEVCRGTTRPCIHKQITCIVPSARAEPLLIVRNLWELTASQILEEIIQNCLPTTGICTHGLDQQSAELHHVNTRASIC